MLFVGIDWAEDHHDLVVMADDGRVLVDTRIGDDLAGVGRLRALVADHQTDADEAVGVGIETDRGLLVTSLVDAGYEVLAVNPMVASRYRDRHSIAGAKSDAGDARMLQWDDVDIASGEVHISAAITDARPGKKIQRKAARC